MDKTQALQNLLNRTASEEDINLLKGGLASGEISIGGNVNQSVIIIGSGNTVELPPAALDRLGGRSLLGDLDRDLTGDEITLGLNRLEAEFPQRAPVLMTQFQAQTHRLRPTLKTNPKSLSDHALRERVEALAQINSLCMEAVDISFNALCLGEEPPEYDSRSPFRGLESFRPEDSEFFFGREALTKKLVDKINSHPFLAVLGASGSGKSSLVMAGLIPALALEYIIFRPGTNPLEVLEAVKENTLVVVDQFEELFTLTRDEATRKEFIAKLLETTKQNKVVITLRSDFLGEVGAYHSLKEEIQSHLEIVPPMDMDELRRAMEGQAGQVNLRFEADLSQQILDDVEGEPGAMPLLQHALWELWNRRHGRNLRASEYRAFGGVKQAITSTAEKVYGECTKAEQEQVRDIFLRLTRLDESDEGRDTRRRVPLGDLIPSGADAASISALVDKLANARLIVKTVNEDKTEVEVAHEALIRHWERLRAWLNEDRDDLRLRESVSESTKEWEKSGRHESLLNSRWIKLDEALLLAQDSRYRLTEIEQAYLKECVSLKNREQRERERRLRFTVAASIAAAIIFLVLGGFGLVKSNEATTRANEAVTMQAKAEEQAHIALARQLAAQAQPLFINGNSKQMTTVLLAIQSMRMFPASEAAQILQNNALAYPIAYMTYDEVARSVAFSPDGKYVVLGSSDGAVRMREIYTGKEIFHMKHDSWVNSVVFSPDSKYVASAGCGQWEDASTSCDQGSARIWKANTGQELAHMTYDYSDVSYVAFSPDSKYVIAVANSTVHVWEISTEQEITSMIHDDLVTSVAVSQDSRYVVSSGGTVARVWDASTGEEIAHMTHDFGALSVAFSPKGKYVASGGCDRRDENWECDQGSVRIWEAETGKEVTRMMHNSYVKSVSFSPTGNYIASGGCEQLASNGSCLQGSVHILEVATGKEIANVLYDDKFDNMSYDNLVTSIEFSANGKYILVRGNNNTVCVLEANTGKEVSSMVHDGVVDSVAFSLNSNYVISESSDFVSGRSDVRVWKIGNEQGIVSMIPDGNKMRANVVTSAFTSDGKHEALLEDNVVRIRNTATGNEIAHMTHDKRATSIAFSPNGNYIISGSVDKTARVWEVATGKEIARMNHDGWVYYVAFSPDGRYVASGDIEGTSRVWEADTGKEIARMTYAGPVFSVAFSPDGKYVESTGCYQFFPGSNYGFCMTGIVQTWIYRPEDLIDDACSRVTRNLTRTEWNQYIGDALPYQSVCPNLPIEPERTPTP